MEKINKEKINDMQTRLSQAIKDAKKVFKAAKEEFNSLKQELGKNGYLSFEKSKRRDMLEKDIKFFEIKLPDLKFNVTELSGFLEILKEKEGKREEFMVFRGSEPLGPVSSEKQSGKVSKNPSVTDRSPLQSALRTSPPSGQGKIV